MFYKAKVAVCCEIRTKHINAMFKYVGNLISDYKSDLEDKIQTYKKINGVIYEGILEKK
jgi:hypothetical protein